jgi:hypothetical protein
MTNKITVHYDPSKGLYLNETQDRYYCFPIDHPDIMRVENGELVITSPVVKQCDLEGVFETRNTIYKPMETF